MTKSAIQILLIEDSQTDMLLLKEALNRDAINSFELTISERLGGALDMLRQRKFDLILLDLGLPDSQGLETFQKLHTQVPETPVVVLTGLTDEKLALAAVQSGAQDFLVKGPASWEIASRAIRHAIERHQSQAAMRETNEAFQALIQASPAGIVVLDADGLVRLWSPANEHIFGWSEDEVLGECLPYVSEDKREEHRQLRERVLQGESFTGVEARRQRKDGSPVDISISTAPLRDSQGKVTGIFGLSMDITERNRAERELRDSEERFRTLIEQSSEGIVLVGEEGNILEWNQAMERITGIPRSLAARLPVWDIQFQMIPSELRSQYSADSIKAVFSKVLQTGNLPYPEERLEVEIQTISGERKTVTQTIFVIKTVSGYRIGSIVLDITERKQAEQALLDSEIRYQSLFEDSPISLWEEDFSEVKKRLDGLQQAGISDFCAYFKDHPQFVAECATLVKIVDVNKATLELYQAKEKEELIKNLSSIFSDESYDDFAGELTHITTGERQFAWESVNRTITGERLDISLTWSVVLGHEDDLSRVIVSVTDITERKRAGEALQESEVHYRTLFEHLPIPAFTKDRQGKYTSSNAENQKYWALSPMDRADAELLSPKEATALHEIDLRVMESGEVLTVEEVLSTPLGKRHFLSRKVPLRDGTGNIVGLLGASIDITERMQAEEAIRLSEKKFKTLFEIAPVGISVLDREQNVVDANYALRMITGLKKKELLNGSYRKRTYLKPDGSLMALDEFASTRALKENMPIFDVETGILIEGRGVTWTQISAAPLGMPDASLVVITQDISERKVSEQTLRQRVAELETLYESGLSLSQLLEPQEIGQKIIDVLAEKLDWYHTTIRLYHPETNSLELLAYNLAHKTTQKERRLVGERFRTLIARPGDGLSGWAVQHGETVRCGDLTRDPRYLETVPGVRSGLYVPIKTGERTIGVISVESEKPDYFTAEDEHMTITLAAQAAVALENIRLFKDLQRSNDDLLRAYDRTIEGWSHALDLRDKETEGHTQRVTTLTEELAREMGIPNSDLNFIRWGALLHDIGKMGVPDRILLKPDKLIDDELVIMRQHPVHAYNLLSQIDFLQPALNIPYHHHERWDGSGYPDGLQGEQIPLEARIFAVIDVFDALTSDRPYRPAWPKDKANRYIREQAGSHFDPRVVDAFEKLIKTYIPHK